MLLRISVPTSDYQMLKRALNVLCKGLPKRLVVGYGRGRLKNQNKTK